MCAYSFFDWRSFGMCSRSSSTMHVHVLVVSMLLCIVRRSPSGAAAAIAAHMVANYLVPPPAPPAAPLPAMPLPATSSAAQQNAANAAMTGPPEAPQPAAGPGDQEMPTAAEMVSTEAPSSLSEIPVDYEALFPQLLQPSPDEIDLVGYSTITLELPDGTRRKFSATPTATVQPTETLPTQDHVAPAAGLLPSTKDGGGGGGGDSDGSEVEDDPDTDDDMGWLVALQEEADDEKRLDEVKGMPLMLQDYVYEEDEYEDEGEEDEVDNGEWHCVTCDASHPAIFTTCRGCGADRPADGAGHARRARTFKKPEGEMSAADQEMFEDLFGSDDDCDDEVDFLKERKAMLDEARAQAKRIRDAGERPQEGVEEAEAQKKWCRKRHFGKTQCPNHAPVRAAAMVPTAGKGQGKGGGTGSGGKPAGKAKAKATRKPRSCDLCSGQAGAMCRFATDTGRVGLGARVTPKRGVLRCVFCDPTRMAQASANSRSKGVVTSALRFFKENGCEDIYRAAMAKVPEVERARIEEEARSRRLSQNDSEAGRPDAQPACSLEVSVALPTPDRVAVPRRATVAAAGA